MTTNTENKLTERFSNQDIVIGILVFGSIWGLLEATLGGFLNMIIFPNKGAIMAGIGVATMSAALAIYRKPLMVLAIGIVAASFKLLNVWIFVPISYVNIVNPAMAIVLESLALTLVAIPLKNRIERNPLVGIGAGALAGIFTATAFFYFALHVTQSPIMERIGVSGAGEYLSGEGLIQTVFYGIFMPMGYRLGKGLTLIRLTSLRRLHYYGASAAIICLCWGIAAMVTVLGL